MMITGNLTNPEEMVARYVRFMFKSDKKGRRKEVDLKENRSSRDGDKVLCNRPHIAVWEPYVASGVKAQPDHISQKEVIPQQRDRFLATLVALHLTPIGE